MIKKFSITGGIGSGKSTVLNILKQLGYYVLDADELTKEAVTQKSVKVEVIKLLGSEAYLSTGVMNREFVRSQVFSSPILREQLEDILHPVIHSLFESRLSVLNSHNISCWVFYEASLIFEKKRYDYFDANILVDADKDVRVQRVREAKNISLEQIAQIMSQQMSTNEKAQLADYMIDNSSTVENLEAKVIDLILFLKNK